MKKCFKCSATWFLLMVMLFSSLIVGESTFAASTPPQYPVDRLPEAVYDVEYKYLKGGNNESPDYISFLHTKLKSEFYTSDKRLEKANSALLYSIFEAYQNENGNFVKYTGKNGVYNVLDSKNKKIGTVTVSKDYKTLVISVSRSGSYKHKLEGTYTGNPKKVMKSIKEVYGFYPMEKSKEGLDQYLVISDKGIQIAKRDFASSKVNYEKAVSIKHALKNGVIELKDGYKGKIKLHVNGEVDIDMDSKSYDYIYLYGVKGFKSLNDLVTSKEVSGKIAQEKSFVQSLVGKELTMEETGGTVVLGANKVTCTQVTREPMVKEAPEDFEVLGHAFVVDVPSFTSNDRLIEVTLVDVKGNVLATLRLDSETKELTEVNLNFKGKRYHFY